MMVRKSVELAGLPLEWWAEWGSGLHVQNACAGCMDGVKWGGGFSRSSYEDQRQGSEEFGQSRI